MLKPNGYDEANAFTNDFETLEAGGYVCKIFKAVSETTTNGNQALVLYFDIFEGDHAGFFNRIFNNAKKRNPDAKWQGRYQQITEGKSLPFFKGMITALEESNSGYKWNWDEKTLAGKLFGGVFGREQYKKQNGDYGWSTKCKFIRNAEAIRRGVFEIPEDKYIQSTFTPQTNESLPDEKLPWEN